MVDIVAPVRKRRTVKKTAPAPANPFIISTSLGDPDAETRKLIRRHVMLGKNKERRKPVISRNLGSWVNGDDDPDCQELQALRARKDKDVYAKCKLRAMGSDLSCIKIAHSLQPGDLELINYFFTVMKPEMYPLDICTSTYPDIGIWVKYLTLDEGYVHSILFATLAYFDWRNGRPLSRPCLAHLSKTLEKLRDRLEKPSDEMVSEPTLSVVTALIIAADCLGDQDSFVKHTRGLLKMITHRGGLGTLRANPQLQVKVCRADLSLAMSTGSKPLFFADGISWKPYLVSQPGPRRNTDLHGVLDNPDPRLVNVWVDLKEFCRAANIAIVTGRKLDPELLAEGMSSVQYRLLHLDYESSTGRDAAWHEALRLSMLAFATSVFLRTLSAEMRYPDLAARLKAAMLALDTPKDQASREMMVWMAVVAGMALFHVSLDRGWSREYIPREYASSWVSVRDVLKSRLWIDRIHDREGQAFFEVYKEDT